MSRRRHRIGIVVIAATVLAACGDSQGASKTERSDAARIAEALDICAEGRGAFARNVCQNEVLAELDQEVRETLVAESVDISDAGAQMLVENQNRWREARRIACGIVDPDAAPTAAQQRCLEGEFRARVREADSAVQQIGGYTFQRMEFVDATPVTAEMAAATGRDDAHAVVRDIRFPRIDGPQRPEIRRFNELVAQQPQFRLQDATNEVIDYRIAFAGPELISVRFDIAQDALMAANVTKTMRAVTVIMTDGRPLAVDDVFRAESGWQDFVTTRAIERISRELPEYPAPPRRDVYETVTKPHLWLITEENLVLLFPPLSITGWSHADPAGGLEVAIPWSELGAYLNPAAPAPIRPSA